MFWSQDFTIWVCDLNDWQKILDLLSISTIPDEVKEEQSGGTVEWPSMICTGYSWCYVTDTIGSIFTM